ncbi:MAG: DinB family protein [Lapillicoccus sp.]
MTSTPPPESTASSTPSAPARAPASPTGSPTEQVEQREQVPERQPGWEGMWLAPEDDPRDQEGTGTDERSVLTDYLRHYRTTLELKCDGLDAGQLARRSVPPSTMSLLGLVRHLAAVEQTWFRLRLSGEEGPRHYRDLGPDGEFDGAVADPAVVEEAFALWKSEIAFAEAYVDAAPDLDHVGASGGVLRDILVHMIEEYARHCGHADLLREAIDGRVGQ